MPECPCEYVQKLSEDDRRTVYRVFEALGIDPTEVMEFEFVRKLHYRTRIVLRSGEVHFV